PLVGKAGRSSVRVLPIRCWTTPGPAWPSWQGQAGEASDRRRTLPEWGQLDALSPDRRHHRRSEQQNEYNEARREQRPPDRGLRERALKSADRDRELDELPDHRSPAHP